MCEKILFIGDSVTDCGRTESADANSLGNGYPKFVNELVENDVANRGISGNRVRNLRDRWQADCIDLAPDVLTILIGINDMWRRFDENDLTSPEKFEEDYRYILGQVKEKLPKTKIIIMEPFLLPVPEFRGAWREDLDPKIHVARKLAYEFGGKYIALDGLFAEFYMGKDPSIFTADGVHPTEIGHKFIAEKWLQTYKSL